MKALTQHYIEKHNLTVIVAKPETEEDFKEYHKVRYEVLRKPWNQPEVTELDEFENIADHLCLLIDTDIIGVVRLQFNSTDEAQVRFMGIKEDFRGFALGNILLEQCEITARDKKATCLFLQSRENAVAFYLRNGFSLIEKTYLLFGEIQHFSMIKNL